MFCYSKVETVSDNLIKSNPEEYKKAARTKLSTYNEYDSSGNFIYKINVDSKSHTENKIKDEHGLQERGQY